MAATVQLMPNLPGAIQAAALQAGASQPQLEQSMSLQSVPSQPTAAAGQAGFTTGSLYVGDLNPDVTETMLYEKFLPCGQILSIRLCRDMVTRRSLGYAYVNFANVTDAERALDTMNFDIVKGRPIRIMWSQRDPSVRRSGVGNIFIKNLDKSIDNKALNDTFSAFGDILSCKISLDHEGNSRGFGFVHFQTEEAAKSAIERVNGMLLNGKKVFVGEFKQRKDRPDEAAARFRNCFIKNFQDYLDDDSLMKLFEPYGTVTSAKVMVDESTGKSRGFGFVMFSEPQSAQAAVADLNGKELLKTGKLATDIEGAGDAADESAGKPMKIYVGRAMKRNERVLDRERARQAQRMERLRKYNGANVYVKNLMEEVDDQKLREEFKQFGNIASARVMKDQHNRSRGFGFICYSTPDEAQKAISEMNGKMLVGKPIYVALAQLKQERQAFLQNRIMQRMISDGGRSGAFAGQPGYSYIAGGQQMGPYAAGAAPTRYPGAAGFRPQRPAMMQQMAARPPQGLMVNPLAAAGFGLGMNAGQMAGFAAGYPAMAGAQMAAAGTGLNASMGRQQPTNWNAQQQRGVAQNAAGGRQQTGAGAGMMGARAITGGNAMQKNEGLMAQQAAAAKTQQTQLLAQLGNLNLQSLPPGLVQDLSNAQRTGLATPQVQAFLQQRLLQQQAAVNPAAAAVGAAAVNPAAAAAAAVGGGVGNVSSSNQELASQLASATPNEQKQILGERLYPLIHEMFPQLAGKITGMLLEMDNSELLHMLEATDLLRSKVSEAYEVLQQHQQLLVQQPAATAPAPSGLLSTVANAGTESEQSN